MVVYYNLLAGGRFELAMQLTAVGLVSLNFNCGPLSTIRIYIYIYIYMYVKISGTSRYHSLHVLQFIHDDLQGKMVLVTTGPCYTVCTRETQLLKYKVRHLLQFAFGGIDPSL